MSAVQSAAAHMGAIIHHIDELPLKISAGRKRVGMIDCALFVEYQEDGEWKLINVAVYDCHGGLEWLASNDPLAIMIKNSVMTDADHMEDVYSAVWDALENQGIVPPDPNDEHRLTKREAL